MSDYPALLAQFQQSVLSRKPEVGHEIAIARIGFDGSAQMQAYINAYHLRLEQAVVNDYPITCQYLGKDIFHSLARSYVLDTRSHSYNLNNYAQGFAAYLCARIQDKAAQDISLFESAIAYVYHAPESPPLTCEHLTANTMVFPARTASKLLSFHYQVFPYWQALQTQRSAQLLQEPQRLVVVRHRNQMGYYPVGEIEYDLLKHLFAGMTLDEALENVPEHALNDSEALLQEWLLLWLERGYFTPM